MSDFEDDSGMELSAEESSDNFLQSNDGEDDAFGFQDVDKEKGKKKDYEVDYQVLEPKDLVNLQEKESSQIQGVLGIPMSAATCLLRQYKWKQDKLIDKYMEDPEGVLSKGGISLDKGNEGIEIMKNFTCEICCMTETKMKTYALACGHRFCFDCYQQYVTMKIAETSDSRIQCMANCKLRFDDTQVRKLVKEEVYEKYERIVNQSYLDDHEHLKWCPAPNCRYAIECHIAQSSLKSIVPSVKCKCEYAFCFGCGLESHQPAICSIVKLWLKKCADDSETANWISANTKECAKCHATIEKNGGCNHMQCKKCKHDFCWVCLGPWSDHGTSWYNCNRYDDKASEDARSTQTKSRAQLERYLHYFTRYDNHHSSAKLEQELYQKIEKKMETLQKNTDLSWIEVQFLKKAASTLFKCRMILKWTYAFAYYLEKNNHTLIFEDNQRDLEMAVEQLSELLEKEIDPKTIPILKQQVLDKTVYVSSRMEILLSDCAQGLLEDRWKYITDVPLF